MTMASEKSPNARLPREEVPRYVAVYGRDTKQVSHVLATRKMEETIDRPFGIITIIG